MKKAASKRRTSASRKSSARPKTKSMSWWEQYCADRDEFYRCHPRVQWLIAIFILLFLLYVAMVFAPIAGYYYSVQY